MPDDFVNDLLQRIVPAHAKLAGSIREQIEADIRRDYGGDRPYIGKTGEDVRAEIAARDARILRQYQAGERVPLLARRHGMSKGRIYQIIAAANHGDETA